MKRKVVKKVLALCTALAMTVGMLSGCGGDSSSGGNSENSSSNNESNSESSSSSDVGLEEGSGQGSEGTSLDTSQEVELVMYVVSDRPSGQDVVDAKINEILKEKLNCTLKINWLGWAEYSNKYPLLFSSGEEFDMAYCATWLNFASLAQKGAFKNLDELWPTYAPDNFAATTEAAKEQATVGGHYYCVPTQLATYTAYGPIYRGDLVEGSSWDGKMETFEDIEEYCDIVKETHPEIEPLDQYSTKPVWSFIYMLNKGYNPFDNGLRYMWYDPTEENPKVFNMSEYEGTPEFLEMMGRWNEKGFYSKSALSDTDSQKFQNGKAALQVHNIDAYKMQAILNPDRDIHYSNIAKDVAHLPFTQDCMVISNTSKNPERAMAFWNLLTTDQELFDAFMYGVEGTTYELDDKGDYNMLDSDLYGESAMWAARTNELSRNQIGTPDDYNTLKETLENTITPGQGSERFAAFVFDTTSIETELAACNNVDQQYWWPLELGYTDAETGLAEYTEKMKAAGIDRIMEEAQKQLDAYVENHK